MSNEIPVAFFNPVSQTLRLNPAYQVHVSKSSWVGEVPLHTAAPAPVAQPAGEPVATLPWPVVAAFPGGASDEYGQWVDIAASPDVNEKNIKRFYRAAAARVPLTPAQQHADELLEALKAMNAGCRDPYKLGLLLAFDMARAVLAKIEGGAA